MSTILDPPWKQILEGYFRPFMAFFFPDAHAAIDWSKGFEFLDAELQQITREAETGKRIVDKLVKVYLLDGHERWILLHIEVQNQKEENFAERIFIYAIRLFDKFRRTVDSFVILGDTDTKWRPQTFTMAGLASRTDFSFAIAKLLDYKKRKEELASSNNPFAVVVQAHLAAQATKGKASQDRRRKQKFLLTTMLYERGYSRQEVIDLFRFTDWVLALPPELESAFREDLKLYEGERQMAYLSSIERMAKAEGEAEGEARGEARGRAEGEHRQKQTIALNLLRKNISLEIIADATKLSMEQLRDLQGEMD